MKPGLWRSLEKLSTQAALLLEWKRELGDQTVLAREFLRPTDEHLGSYPCTNEPPCGCRHRVIFESEDQIVAHCDCQDCGCEPIRLQPVDLVVYRLNKTKLGERIRCALGLNEPPALPFDKQAIQIGTWSSRRSPVYFYIPINASGTLQEFERLCSLVKRPFIFLTPTGAFTQGQGFRAALARNRCMHLDLTGVVEPTSDQHLVLTTSGQSVWEAALADFQKLLTSGSDTETILRGIHNEIASVRTDFHELRKAKARLEQMQSEGLFKFTQQVDAKSFKVLCTVLAQGDVAKASRALDMSDTSLRRVIREWTKRDPTYKRMADLVRWRKTMGSQETVTLKDSIITEKAPSVNYPALIADVLDAILSMTEGTWEDKVEELAELLRPVVR